MHSIPITKESMKDVNWPEDLILDLGKANWLEWSRTLRLSVRQCSLRPWLENSLPCPNPSASPDTHYIWMHNDDALCTFMLHRVLPADFDHTNSCTSASQLFECLRILHENQEAYAQISLLIKALDICLSYKTPLCDTLSELHSYYQYIIAIGKIKDDDIFTAILLHSMSGDFVHLQQSVQNMRHLSNFNSEMIAKRILDEDALICRRKELGQRANPNDLVTLTSQTIHVTQTRTHTPKPFCTNCKKDNHSVNFCISAGGKMAGCTAEEAKAAYRAKFLHPPRLAAITSSMAHVASIAHVTSNPSPLIPSTTAALAAPSIPIIVKGITYSGLQNCCNVWPFSTELNVALNRVGIALRVC